MGLMYGNVFLPLIVIIMFIKPLVEVHVVPEHLSPTTWGNIRVLMIVLCICLRLLTFREELQFHFNESYFLVQKLMVDKNEKIFRYVRLRMQENFLNTWYLVF